MRSSVSELGRTAPAEIVVCDDPDALATEAAARVAACIAAAVSQHGEAHVALTGGSSAQGLYRALRAPAIRTGVPWSKVHLWWGDERFVPLDHPDSNAGLGVKLLLDPGIDEGVEREVLPVPPAQVHPMPVRAAIAAGDGPAGAAERYEAELTSSVPRRAGSVPVLDLVLLGMGPDGHTLSVFPGSAALDSNARVVMGVPAPAHVEPHRERVTLSPRVLGAADGVLMMVTGSAKAEMVRQVLQGDRDPLRWPAQLAVLPQAVWLLDRQSAAQLNL